MRKLGLKTLNSLHDLQLTDCKCGSNWLFSQITGICFTCKPKMSSGRCNFRVTKLLKFFAFCLDFSLSIVFISYSEHNSLTTLSTMAEIVVSIQTYNNT